MKRTHIKTCLSAARLCLVTYAALFGLEVFLFRLSDYNIYRILEISFADGLLLSAILTVQYLLWKPMPPHIRRITHTVRQNKKAAVFPLAVVLGGTFLYLLSPATLPFWTFPLTAAGFYTMWFLINKTLVSPVNKIIFTLLFGAALNAGLIFWMHEEANAGRHLRYARQLAESRDTTAIREMQNMTTATKGFPLTVDEDSYWEEKYLQSPYLTSNYLFSIESGEKPIDATFYRVTEDYGNDFLPTYRIYFPENYALVFRLKKDFRRSIYSPGLPYKNLQDLRDYQFSVVHRGRAALSNTHNFDLLLREAPLPALGTGKKTELQGFDLMVYHHDANTYVLIGEPLSEAEIFIANFAFFFSLFLVAALLLEMLLPLFTYDSPAAYWQDLPLQYRIQAVLIGVTCVLFFVIAAATFAFLRENNSAVANEQQMYLAETLKEELMSENIPENLSVESFARETLARFADRYRCDLDFYNAEGNLVAGSFASAAGSPAPAAVPDYILQKITNNPDAVFVTRLQNDAEFYYRTYFGVMQSEKLTGIAAAAAFESEIGTTPYISTTMVKLLSVYVFLLLLIWATGLLLIGILTRPLHVLAGHLRDFKLGKENKKLKWKGNDAIGKLISEYNQMTDKVRETTEELMQNEREEAWQIMAQQIAHEINNRLTPLRLNVQFLLRILENSDTAADERVTRITDGLTEKIDGLSKVAGQFKLFARLDDPQVQPIPVRRFLAGYTAAYEKKEDIEYAYNPSDVLPETVIHADPEHLREVLNNLFSNAENALAESEHGKIELSLYAKENRVFIEVADNGTGIAPEKVQRLFDPKFSVTSSQTGLGLSVCKKITEYYGGKLNFVTEPGTGTRFMLSFARGEV